MANVNKVEYAGKTLMDLTGDTVTPEAMLEAYTAHDKSGTSITGTIPSKSATDVTVSGKTVAVPAGYYGEAVSKSVTEVSQATPAITVSDSGLVTASADQAAGYVAEGVKTATKQLTVQAAKTVTPSASEQTAVESGRYTTGAVKVAGDANLVAGNIKSGVSIFGVAGSYEGSGGGGESDTSAEDGIIARTISGAYSNDRVTSIGNYAFYYCSSLTSVNFPSCTSIGTSAFVYCSSLTSVNFPACTSIGTTAFGSCSSLTSVSFPVCTRIGINAFNYCRRLTSVNFPACTSIGAYAFGSCSSLTSVSFPSCTSMGTSAFYYCTSLTSVSFPVCTSIGSYAFGSCSSLTSVSFPVCTSMGSSAFSYCRRLTSVNFPACTSIGAAAFYYCTSLTAFYLPGSSVPTLANVNAFASTPMSLSTYTGAFGSIYVPASLVASYQAATNWATYSSRITAIEE